MTAIEPVRGALQRARRRLRGGIRAIIQTALGVGGSWLFATEVLGYDRPFFAPIAAVITLGAASGAPARRALELAGGVALGIAIGDLLILAIGTGTVQIVVVVVLAMAMALAVGGSVLVVNQAVISAILVATLLPPTVTLVPHRVFHAAIGGVIGVLIGHVLLRAPPLPAISKASDPVFEGLSAALLGTAAALKAGDPDQAVTALLRARSLDPKVRALHQTHADAVAVLELSISRRTTREQLRELQAAVVQLDLAVRNTRVLARSVIALLRTDPTDPDDDAQLRASLSDAVVQLAAGVEALGDQLTRGWDATTTRRYAAAAGRQASRLFPDRRSLAIARIVGQIRSTSIDLLRGSGLELWTAQQNLEVPVTASRSDQNPGPGDRPEASNIDGAQPGVQQPPATGSVASDDVAGAS